MLEIISFLFLSDKVSNPTISNPAEDIYLGCLHSEMQHTLKLSLIDSSVAETSSSHLCIYIHHLETMQVVHSAKRCIMSIIICFQYLYDSSYYILLMELYLWNKMSHI